MTVAKEWRETEMFTVHILVSPPCLLTWSTCLLDKYMEYFTTDL